MLYNSLSQGDVIGVLCSAVRDCKNFKVRINAALALTTPHKRCQYGDAAMFLVVWKGLMEALETAEDISDYIDFRYRDSLTDQVCILALKAPITTKVVCFCLLLKSFRSLLVKQYEPRSDCS